MANQASMTKYVAYLLPGSHIYPKMSFQRVDSRNLQQQANVAPEDAFGFFYCDAIGQADPEEFGNRNNTSSKYYINAKVLNTDEVKDLPGDNTVLLDNMLNRGWGTVVQCRNNVFQPFFSDDHVITTS